MRFVVFVSLLSVASLGCGRPSTTEATSGRIAGTVTLAGIDPQPPITVTLSGPVAATTTTTASGAYAFADLPAGQYTVGVAEAYTLEGSASTTVDVASSAATARPLRLTPAGSVSGTITLAGLDPQPLLTVTLAGAVVVTTVADPSGAYTFGLVPLGEYVVSVADPRTVEGSAGATVRVGMGPSSSPALRLTPIGSVSGVVALPGLDAQPCLTVTLSGPVVLSTLADAAGSYSFAHLPIGDYSVSVAEPSTLEGSATAAVRVGLGVSIAPVLQLTPLGTLSGAVVLRGTWGRPGLAVSFTGPTSGAGVTDAFGRYRFGPLPVGTYVVTVSEPYSVEGSASTAVLLGLGPAAAPDLSLTPTGRLTGRIVLSHTPPRAGLRVKLLDRRTGLPISQTATDADGAYSFGPMLLTPCTVSATAPSTAESTLSAAVDVGFGPTTAPDLAFTALGGVAGSVTVAGASAAANAVVWAQGSSRAALTGPDGTFLLAVLPAGTYPLVASRAGLDTSTMLVDVSYAATSTVTFALQASAAGQPGTARLSGAASVLGVGRAAGITVAVDGTALSAISAADGSWTIEAVPDGLWSLTLTDGVRVEHVPAAFAISGADGFLLDGTLYPIGEIELQNAPRITSRTAASRQLTADGYLVVLDGTDLLSAPLAGSPVARIATGVQRFQLPSAATGRHGWIAVFGTDGAVSAVRASGGPAIPVANLTLVEFDPTGDVLMGRDGDGRLWYAALERGDVRPVARGWGSILSLAPGYFRFADSTTGGAGTVEYATGNVTMWGARSVCDVRAAAGGRVVVKESGAGPCYGRVLVGAPGAALTEVAPASATLFNLGHAVSPDGQLVAVSTLDLTTSRAGLVVAAAEGSVLVSEPNALFGEWSPDSARYTWRRHIGSSTLQLATSVGGASISTGAPPTSALFSPDGRFLAVSDGTATKVLSTADGTVVAEVAGASQLPFAYSADSRFLVTSGASLESVSLTDGAVTFVSSLSAYTSVERSPDGQHLLFWSEEGFSTAPLSGAPRVLLVPAGISVGARSVVAPSDAVLFESADGFHVVPIEGGAFLDLGTRGPSGEVPSVAADGLSIAQLDGAGVLRSAALPAGTSEIVASGVASYQRAEAGLVIRHVGGALSVAGPTGAATPVGTGVTSWTIAPGGRVIFSDDADRLFTASLPSGATTLLATDVLARSVRADRVAAASGGVLCSTPTAGGPLAAHLRLEPTALFQWSWLDDRHGVAVRVDAPPPYRFQNGLYLVTVP